MIFFATVPPLKSRALEGECGPAVLNTIGNKLGRVTNLLHLKNLMPPHFQDSEIHSRARTLEDLGYVSSQATTALAEMKNLALTDAGRAESGVNKPFHSGGAA